MSHLRLPNALTMSRAERAFFASEGTLSGFTAKGIGSIVLLN